MNKGLVHHLPLSHLKKGVAMNINVEFFRPSGRWYTTETVPWHEVDKMLVQENLSLCLREHFSRGSNPGRLTGMIAVCIDVPDYQPIMGRWDGQNLAPVIEKHVVDASYGH